MSKPYETTGHWSATAYDLRGVEKPYYVVFDGEKSEKTLHRHILPAMREAQEIRETGRPAGVLKIHPELTQVVVSMSPKIQPDYSPLEFATIL